MNTEKRFIAFDISLSKTGAAYYYAKKIELDIIKNNNGIDCDTMYLQIKEYIDINTLGFNSDDFVFIIEGFTKSIIRNDRTGSASELIRLIDKVKDYIKSLGFEVFDIMPWVWRSFYNLPTMVGAYDEGYKVVARTEGHDLLKGMSIILARLLVDHFNKGNSYDIIGFDEQDEDKAEALLILLAYKTSGGIFDNEEVYVNMFHVERCINFEISEMKKLENGEVITKYIPVKKGYRYSDFNVFLNRNLFYINNFTDFVKSLNEDEYLYFKKLNLEGITSSSGGKLWRG